MEESYASWCMPVSQADVQLEDSEIKGESKRKLLLAIRKSHVNLGHASTADMLRILRHHGAQEQVLEHVKAFECGVCKARQLPKSVKDSATPGTWRPSDI